MPIYNFWYRRTFSADNLNEAIKKEKKLKLQFDSVTQEDEPETQVTDAIGFHYHEDDEDYED